jgi:hypothetical membrane protein
MKTAAKKFALCGVAAPPVFALMLVVFSLLTPGYTNLTNGISELGVRGAPYTLAWNSLGFALVGLLITAFAWGLRQDLRPGPGAWIVPLLVALSGIGFAGLGFFPAEAGYAPSILTTLHFTLVAVNFLPFIFLAFIFAVRLKTNDFWKNRISFSMLMGVMAVASFFIPKSIPGGISQRVGLGAYFLWLLVIGLALLRKPTSGRP